MASSLPNPKVSRTKPEHYYEGMMKKKGQGEKLYKKYWAGLLGNSLYFYNHHKDVQYIDVINLQDFVSVSDDNSPCKIPTESKFTLQLKNAKVHLKVDSSEYREMWKGFILTVVQMKVPTELSLLPGPRHMMSEVLKKERERRAELEKEYDEAKDEELVPCFYKVSRLEAEDLLKRNPECGNLIIRPGRDSTCVSVSTCQNLNGTNIVKHYRVNQCRGVYIIEVEQPVRCKSLVEVMNYFIEKTSNTLTPFLMDEDYEDHISFVTNQQNVENVIRTAGRFARQSPQDTRGNVGYPHSSRNPPPIPSEPLPNDEDEVENSDEEQDQLYMNEDADPSRMTPSSSQPDGLRLPAVPRKLPSKPSNTTEDTPVGRKSSVGSVEIKALPRQPPQLPKFVPPPMERVTPSNERAQRPAVIKPFVGGPGQRGPAVTRSNERLQAPVQPRQVANSRPMGGQGRQSIENELNHVLKLRYNRC